MVLPVQKSNEESAEFWLPVRVREVLLTHQAVCVQLNITNRRE
jgi:hypothetical protein